jgi:ribosomal protein S18 acetylase RimI-like enzyme
VSRNLDGWLSEILGKPAYHWTGAEPVDALPAGPAFVDAKVSTDDVAGLLRLQTRGFAVLDVNIQMSRDAVTIPAGTVRVRAATPGDAAAVRMLASEAFVYDRFHRDPKIGHDAAARLKAEWAENYFAGKRGDRMIIAENDEGLCGFLQLLRAQDGATVIDLVGVDARSRRKGVARSMIALAANTPGNGPMRVGTQAANITSLALYETLGFRIASSAYVLHMHIEG